MFTDTDLNDDTKPTALFADADDDSCILQYIEIVPLTRDTDDPGCKTEFDSEDWSAQVNQENLPVVKPVFVIVCSCSLI